MASAAFVNSPSSEFDACRALVAGWERAICLWRVAGVRPIPSAWSDDSFPSAQGRLAPSQFCLNRFASLSTQACTGNLRWSPSVKMCVNQMAAPSAKENSRFHQNFPWRVPYLVSYQWNSCTKSKEINHKGSQRVTKFFDFPLCCFVAFVVKSLSACPS